MVILEGGPPSDSAGGALKATALTASFEFDCRDPRNVVGFPNNFLSSRQARVV